MRWMGTSLCWLVHKSNEVLRIVCCIEYLGSEVELLGLEFIHGYNKHMEDRRTVDNLNSLIWWVVIPIYYNIYIIKWEQVRWQVINNSKAYLIVFSTPIIVPIVYCIPSIKVGKPSNSVSLSSLFSPVPSKPTSKSNCMATCWDGNLSPSLSWASHSPVSLVHNVVNALICLWNTTYELSSLQTYVNSLYFLTIVGYVCFKYVEKKKNKCLKYALIAWLLIMVLIYTVIMIDSLIEQ